MTVTKAITYIYHTKLDIYRTEVSSKFDKVAIAFARNKQICGMSACGIKTKNDTILSELEYKFYQKKYDDGVKMINTKEGYSNFYKKFLTDEYLYELPDEYFKSVGATRESISAELGKLRNAINSTKQAASLVERTSTMGNPSFETYDVENCAEVWSVRKAIMEGAKFEDIEYKCVHRKSGTNAEPCENCKRTFEKIKNSGKEEEWYAE